MPDGQYITADVGAGIVEAQCEVMLNLAGARNSPGPMRVFLEAKRRVLQLAGRTAAEGQHEELKMLNQAWRGDE